MSLNQKQLGILLVLLLGLSVAIFFSNTSKISVLNLLTLLALLFLMIIFFFNRFRFRYLFSRSTLIVDEQINIPWSLEANRIIREAKKAIQSANPKESLKQLFRFESTTLNKYLYLLEARLSRFYQDQLAGTHSNEELNNLFNRILRDILSLISIIEENQSNNKISINKMRNLLKKKYDKRLNDKLSGRQPVNLRFWASKKGVHKRTSDAFITYDSIKIQDEIGNVFNESYGRLMIVGEPGAGKTILLLQLANCLLEMEEDVLPVLLNLATWQSRFIRLKPWLEETLSAELSVDKASVKVILQQSNLVLLLDGLDEVVGGSRKSCLDAIADYGIETRRRFVITSRTKEYERIRGGARVKLQIEVAPLTSEQVEDELEKMGHAKPEAIPLLQAIRSDALLRKVVETPFYLNTLQLLFAGKIPTFSSNKLKGYKSEIIEKFIEYELTNTKNKEYLPDHVIYWLAYLSYQMRRYGIVNFELGYLQYSWWPKWSTASKVIARQTYGLVVGLSMIIIIWPFIWLRYGSLSDIFYWIFLEIVVWLFLGLVIGGIIGLIVENPPKIETLDVPRWSLKGYLIALRKEMPGLLTSALVLGLLAGLLFGLLGSILGKRFYILLGGPLATFHEILPENISLRILAVSLFGLIVGALTGGSAGISLGFIISINSMINSNFSRITQITSPYQRFIGSMKSLHFSILQHWVLRYQLNKKNVLPIDLVDFLNEMTNRNLMESDGATWRFRHLIIQEYFAKKWKK